MATTNTKKATTKKPVAKKTTTKKAPVKKTVAKKTTRKVTKRKAPKKVLVSVQDIYKNYGKTKVLKGISFDIHEGERVALIGANGAGKSTLTEIISQIKEPSKGKVEYSFGKTKHEISANIGIQFQKSSYPMFYKVNDIARFFIDTTGKKISNEELDDLFKKYGLYEVRKQYATGLSGGQQQRLNILLALAHKPELLLLDELSTGLDVEARADMKRFVKKQLKELNATLLLVSHNPDEIEYLTDRVIVLNGGKIFEDISMKEIKKKWSRFDDYIDDLFMNRFKKEGEFK